MEVPTSSNQQLSDSATLPNVVLVSVVETNPPGRNQRQRHVEFGGHELTEPLSGALLHANHVAEFALRACDIAKPAAFPLVLVLGDPTKTVAVRFLGLPIVEDALFGLVQ